MLMRFSHSWKRALKRLQAESLMSPVSGIALIKPPEDSHKELKACKLSDIHV